MTLKQIFRVFEKHGSKTKNIVCGKDLATFSTLD